MVPYHIWRPLVEKAGFKIEDIPKTWDAFFDFFKEVQDNLREQGERNVYGLGFQVTTNGVDPIQPVHERFSSPMAARTSSPRTASCTSTTRRCRQAAIKAMAYLGDAYKEGFVPPSAINWNDADDNNAFHAKLIVMDFDGTISTEVAVKEKNRGYYNDIVTHGIGYPNDNEGKPVPSIVGFTRPDPEGGEERHGGQGVPEIFIQPKVLSEFVELGLGRWLPVMPSLVKSPFWQNPKDPHRAATSSRACSARPCRTTTRSTRRWPRSTPSMSGAWR